MARLSLSLHYRYFTEDFNKKKLILGRFLIRQKSVLVLDLFFIKGHLKLRYEIKILLLLVMFLFATFWQYFSFNELFSEVTYVTMQGFGLYNRQRRRVFLLYAKVSIMCKE